MGNNGTNALTSCLLSRRSILNDLLHFVLAVAQLLRVDSGGSVLLIGDDMKYRGCLLVAFWTVH